MRTLSLSLSLHTYMRRLQLYLCMCMPVVYACACLVKEEIEKRSEASDGNSMFLLKFSRRDYWN